MAAHLEDAADVGWLRLVEKQRRLRRVRIDAAFSLQKTQRHERVEEVARRSLVQTQPLLKIVERERLLRQLGEQLHLDGAQERSRRPEPQSYLQNVLGIDSLLYLTLYAHETLSSRTL